ncbi:restriction endonuclease subunit S [Gemmobacter denitrificans]|uniref:Restriction endonuclease subunit S n=1 Tax=Gemmobacter denitrificans TaxID=3123040 RepID=A0ABU8BZF1_9RHOB
MSQVSDWPSVLLDSVARRGSGHTPKKGLPAYWNGGIPWISLQDSQSLDRPAIHETSVNISALGLANSSARLHPRGTVVLSRDAGVGKSTIMATDMAVSQHFIAWTCGPLLNNMFLYFLLQHRKPEFERIAVGSTIQTIGLPYFKTYEIPLPPLPEQQAIAAALSDADGVVAGLERAIAKKRLIKQGAMQDLLTARRRLPGFSGEWEVKRLGEVARVATGGRNNQDKDPMGEYPFFVRSDTVERIRSFSYDCEAILVPGEGRIGEIFHYINGRFDVHQRVYCISAFSERTSGRFVYFVLRQFFGAHAMINTVKATVDSLRRPTFTGFEFRCPPSFDEQQAIAAVLSDMDAEIQTLESRLVKARAVKEGMMQNLLTGRVRLV